MAKATMLDWTDVVIQIKLNEQRAVKYQVFRENERYFLDVRNSAGRPIHTLELPDGMKLDRSSYEVLLRYVLLDLAAA